MMVGCGGESDPTSHVAMMHISEYEIELALLLKDSNGLLSAPMQYGSDPNSAITWDADRILGCHCNEGNEGFTCNLRSCPTGTDPLLDGDNSLYTSSNHRICNHDTGDCKCLSGRGSSDGNGNLGSLKDYGHRLVASFSCRKKKYPLEVFTWQTVLDTIPIFQLQPMLCHLPHAPARFN
jgi:hypothetical protein